MHKLKALLQIIVLLVVCYFLLRLVFLINNFNSFSFSSIPDCFLTFFYGLRFDISAIAFTNGLFFLLYVLPLNVFYKKGYQLMLKVLFLLSNIPAFLFNMVDAGYFSFTQKRTTADFFGVMTMGEDFKNMLPGIISDYWFLLLLFLVFAGAFVFFYNRIEASVKNQNKKSSTKYYQWLAVPVTILVIVVAARGGTQYKPLSIIGAARYASTQNVAVVLNSTFTVIRTIGKEELQELNVDTIKNKSAYFNPVHNYSSANFKRKNVVVIIMESFSKEYIGWFNKGKGYTPFLDSLITKSFVCYDAFANAKKSIEGIPAVVAGIPSLMNSSYIASTYNGNKLNSLPLLLKKYGYASAFFHGGNNGTMGFDSFTRMAGFDNYVGRNEYNGDDYDGTWGIYDEPFLKFYSDEMNKMKQPFVTTFFSISSHHPYKIPARYENVFGNGLTPHSKSIRYADFALKQFFNYASKQSWFNNTLFVITADHTGPILNASYKNRTGIYAIPIIFYDPADNLPGIDSAVAQQTDIVPSVLDYINYPDTFKFYGESVFDSVRTGYNVNYLAGNYQLITNQYVVNFDGEKLTGFFSRSDVDFKNNLAAIASVEKDSLFNKLKLIVADYNSSMIYNHLTQP